MLSFSRSFAMFFLALITAAFTPASLALAQVPTAAAPDAPATPATPALPAAALPALPGAPALPPVMAQIPSSSALIIYIPKISDANAKITQYLKATTFDKTMGQPNGVDTLALLLKETGLADGLDTDGSAAFVMPVIQLMGEPRVYFILPLKDKDKFLANFATAQPVPPSPNGATYKDVLLVKTKQGPSSQTSYIKFVGNYVVFGNQPASVDKQAAPDDSSALLTNAGPLAASVMASSDAVLYFNMSKVGPIFQPMVGMFLSNAQLQMSQNPDAAAAMGGPDMAVATFEFYRVIINAIFSQTQAIVVGANIHESSVTTRTAVQFKPDSMLAKTFAPSAPAPASLNKLPADSAFLLCGAFSARAIDIKPFLASLQTESIDKMPADAPARAMMNLFTTGLGMFDKFDDAAFLWLAPEKGNPASLMNTLCIYDAKDPAALRNDYRAIFKSLSDVMAKSAAANAAGQPAPSFSLEPDALTVSNLKTDRALLKIPQPDQGEGMPMRAMNPMAQMFAQPLQYLITNTDQSLVLSTGQQQQLEKILKSAAANSSDFVKSEKLASVRKQLPADRFAEGYFDLGRYIDFTAGMVMAMFGNTPNVKTPDLPPLAFAAASDHHGGILITTVVANNTVAGIRDYTQAMQAAMANPPGTPVRVADPDHNAGAPGEIITVSDKEFDDKVVKANYPVIVVFTANYSMDGKKQEKILNDMMQQYMGDVGFARVDTGSDNRTAENLKLDALPSTVVYAGGKVVAKFSGIVAKDKLIEAITPHVK